MKSDGNQRLWQNLHLCSNLDSRHTQLEGLTHTLMTVEGKKSIDIRAYQLFGTGASCGQCCTASVFFFSEIIETAHCGLICALPTWKYWFCSYTYLIITLNNFFDTFKNLNVVIHSTFMKIKQIVNLVTSTQWRRYKRWGGGVSGSLPWGSTFIQFYIAIYSTYMYVQLNCLYLNYGLKKFWLRNCTSFLLGHH